MNSDQIQTVAAALTLGNAVEGASYTVGPWPDSEHPYAILNNEDDSVVARADDAFDAARAFVMVEEEAKAST